jgi:hypothetical protein
LSVTSGAAMDFVYTPEPTDKSTKILFVQVLRQSLDGVPVKPSAVVSDFAYQDADTTGDMRHVDCEEGEKDPFYNGDDKGLDDGDQGNALAKTPVAATMNDTPGFGNRFFPKGTSTLLYEFRTAAFSAAGEDRGTYYGYVDWTFTKVKWKPPVTAVIANKTGDPGSELTSAVSLFCGNHGFVMPAVGGEGGLGK